MSYYDLEALITSYCSSNSKTYFSNSTTGFAIFYVSSVNWKAKQYVYNESAALTGKQWVIKWIGVRKKGQK